MAPRDPSASLSLHGDAYTQQRWFETDQAEIIGRSWQWVCHREKLRTPGNFITETIAGMPILVLRDHDGELRAFYNVCKHRAHELLGGEGQLKNLVCPYHGWSYDLTGQLKAARHTNHLVDFDTRKICLDQVQVNEFSRFIYVNLDPNAAPLCEQSGDLGSEIERWAPDVEQLTFARRLTYEIKSNWKNMVDNFLECYHCHVARQDFVSLVNMDTYKVTTHGIYSSHMAETGKTSNTAYNVSDATVTDHAVWWLWPNTAMMRYPGRGNFSVLKIVPLGPDLTYETYDFFLETAEPNEAELESIPLPRRSPPGGRHQPRGECPARHVDARIPTRPHRQRPRRIGTLRTRSPPLPRTCARRIHASCVMTGTLAGRVALVTGGRGGAGRAVAGSATAEASTEERILDAVIAVLAQEGLAGVSMRAVARQADVAVGLADYYFDNKTALICAALRRIGDKDMDLVTPPEGKDPSDQLRYCLRQALDPTFLEPDYLSLRLQLWSLAGVNPQFAEINHEAQLRYVHRLADLIEAARPDLSRDDIERRAADILIEQNGVWLTAILIADSEAVTRALMRCEDIAFG